MKCCHPLSLAFIAASLGSSDGQTLVDGSNYPGLFSSPGNVTVDPITSSPGLTSFLKVVVDPDTQASGALVPATALSTGERFASVSNLSVTQVPEPSTVVPGLLSAAVGLRRRR